MGVVAFDSDVLIGFLSRHDAHHQDAVTWMRDSLVAGTRRLLCAVNYAGTSLRLPDAFALATAIHAEHRGLSDIRLASFDDAVLKAHAELHPAPRT